MKHIFGYIRRLDEIKRIFSGIEIRFIIGIETFDNKYRIKTLKKNFYLTEWILKKVKKEYYTVLLLIYTESDKRTNIKWY